MKITTTTKAVVADYVSTLEYAKKRLAVLRKHQAVLTKTLEFVERIFAKFEDSDTLNLSIWPEVNCYNWGHECPIKLRMTVTAKVSSMKIGLVPQVLKAMLDAEFDTLPTKDCANEYSATREFRFERGVSAHFLPMELTMNAVIQDAPDATCRKVQTGVEVLEVPKFEIQCE